MILLNSKLLLMAAVIFARPQAPASAQILPAPEGCKMLSKETLALRMEPHAREMADLIRDANTTLEPLPTPFFRRGGVYRVINRAPHHPIWFTVGCAGPDYNVTLAMNPSGFMELATKADLHFSADEDRLAYLTVFLESTHDLRKRFQILNSISDMEMIANAGDREKARYQTLVEKYRSVIRPAKLADQARAVVFALIGQALVEIKLTLSNSGKVERTDQTLEKDLPINYTR